MEARMGLGIGPRLQQRLVMTPALQLAIQILQLSTVELQELVQKELTENPMLEEAAPEDGGPPAPSTPEPAAEAAAAADEPVLAEGGGVTADSAELPFDLSEVVFGPPEERTLVQQEEHEDTRFENFVGTVTSLADHLSEQLRLSPVAGVVRMVAEEVIGNLDEDGYLRATTEELVARTGADPEVVEDAVRAVQGLDPPGVGARDMRECLLIQLRQQEMPDPLAIDILSTQFEAFQRCRYPDIAKALRVDVERVREAVDEIARLEPKPGRRFGAAETRYVVPDVFVHKVGDDYVIVLNDEGIPRLRVNGYYRSVIGRAPGDEARRYVEDRLRSALWLIKSVHQRQKTLYKVTRSIVHFQRGFLDHGIAHLRPLSLRHVAEDIQMHESTVSRVTTNKYVQTPQGLFELKYFFHSGIAQDHGDEVSSVSVKQMIEALVAQEDGDKPLSDQDVTRLLRERGLNIARRTVAKYREELAILPSHQRRLVMRKRSSS